jgi:hypothetical protein
MCLDVSSKETNTSLKNWQAALYYVIISSKGAAVLTLATAGFLFYIVQNSF